MSDQWKTNDEILVVTRDRDVIRDRQVRQDAGLLWVDHRRWALPMTDPIPWYEYRRVGDQPTPARKVFAYLDDPDPAENSADVANRVLPAVSRMAERGTWRPNRSLVQRVEWKYVLLAVMMAAYLFIAWGKWNSQQDTLEHERRIELLRETLQGQPDYSGQLPTQAELEAVIAAGEAAIATAEAGE